MKKTILLFYSIFLFSAAVNAQSFQWAQREGDQSHGSLITTDDAGNSYVYGRIFISTTVAGQSLNIANGDHFIAKYDNTGSSVWVKQLDSMEVSDLDCSNTDLYVSGRYRTGASFGGTPVAGGSGWDGYVARVNSGGSVTWIQTITNPLTYESANSVSADNSGNLYVSGTFDGSTAMIGTTALTGPGMESMFLLKMAPAGTITWSKTVSANAGGSVSGNEIEVAPSGDIYVMSTAEGDTAHYDSFHYFAGSYPAELLIHYSNSGTLLDVAEINHISQDNVVAMTVDNSGNVYTLQTNYLTSFDLAKFSPTLDTTWVITDGTGGHLSVRDVEVMQSGQIMVAGDVGEDATFGGTYTLYDHGGSNGFLAFYNTNGTFASIEVMPGSVFMGTTGMDASDNIYLTGNLNDSASFDAIDLTTTGVEAMFTAKYSLSTGISSLTENSFAVYPNPCSTVLNCSLEKMSGPANVKLFNALGEMVFEKQSVSGNLQLDLSVYEEGIYILNISNARSSQTKKIVVN
jgi:hypothetical protein